MCQRLATSFFGSQAKVLKDPPLVIDWDTWQPLSAASQVKPLDPIALRVNADGRLPILAHEGQTSQHSANQAKLSIPHLLQNGPTNDGSSTARRSLPGTTEVSQNTRNLVRNIRMKMQSMPSWPVSSISPGKHLQSQTTIITPGRPVNQSAFWPSSPSAIGHPVYQLPPLLLQRPEICRTTGRSEELELDLELIKTCVFHKYYLSEGNEIAFWEIV